MSICKVKFNFVYVTGKGHTRSVPRIGYNYAACSSLGRILQLFPVSQIYFDSRALDS